MGRKLVRGLVFVLAFLFFATGVSAAGVGGWLSLQLNSQDGFSSEPTRIPSSGCETVLVDVDRVTVDLDQMIQIPGFLSEAEPVLVVSVRGSDGQWLVGSAQSSTVADTLLGTSYCLASMEGEVWKVERIAVREDDPSPDLLGVSGFWATTDGSQRVVLGIPGQGTTIAVASLGNGELEAVEVVADLRFPGAKQGASYVVALGLSAVVISIGLVSIAVFAMRKPPVADPRPQETSNG